MDKQTKGKMGGGGPRMSLWMLRGNLPGHPAPGYAWVPEQQLSFHKALYIGGLVFPIYKLIPSFSILFNHPSFQKLDPFFWVSGGFLERRIPGKNGESTPRINQLLPEQLRMNKTIHRHGT